MTKLKALLLCLALMAGTASETHADNQQKMARFYSRPTTWFRDNGRRGPFAIRYYLGLHATRILIEKVEYDGDRKFYWGNWKGPRNVVPDAPFPFHIGLALTGQLEKRAFPPGEIFYLADKAYRPQGLQLDKWTVSGTAPVR